MALKDHILKLADGVSKCQENAKSLAQVIFRGLDDIADNLPEHPGGGSDVSVTQVLSSGTKTATITVDNTPTDLYAPDPTDVDVTQVVSTGTKIATITVDSTPTDLYAPSPTTPTDVDVTQVVSTGTKIATITVDNVPTDIYAPSASGHNYSSTEQVIGKWVDNSDIYEITFTALSTTTTGANWCEISGTDIPNLSKVLNCKAYNIAVDGNFINMAIAETAKSPNSRVQLTVVPGYDREINYMIVQYTKSS